MYTVIVRNCSIGTVWDQDSQAYIRCDDPQAVCRGTAPKPPMGPSHCPFPDHQTGLRPTKSMNTWGESCTDSVGNTLTSVVEDEQIYYILQYPRAPVGPVSCFPHRFSLSRCGCEAPVFSSIIFQYEEDYASKGKTAYSEPNDVAHASLCENTIEVPDMARVGDGALCNDEFGHVEIPYFKNNPPDYPFTIHFFYWLDEDVNTEGTSIALLNNGKCDILTTV
ncbi:uncharacterized protein LOC106153561 [Lingula anatina]|uniref:Uncharacterized protein LOC106153561 n=1 Tax=Lingula anatina TaxID=7574 RepID=A0A2R2MMN4_LINAN|nr:uncharacterized protein LOC106153561 [Lingula anatina]|eukprot:XP_023931459.1 uncharacterized protein LOC106153561 [Lingula anatina]